MARRMNGSNRCFSIDSRWILPISLAMAIKWSWPVIETSSKSTTWSKERSCKYRWWEVQEMTFDGANTIFFRFEGFDERLGKFQLSPDGSLIVFINRNGRLHFVSAKVSVARCWWTSTDLRCSSRRNWLIQLNCRVISIVSPFGMTVNWCSPREVGFSRVPDSADCSSRVSDEGFVTVFDVRRRAAIHRFVDDGSYSTTSMCVSPNQQYFITG